VYPSSRNFLRLNCVGLVAIILIPYLQPIV
jgi:hypothetical protein